MTTTQKALAAAVLVALGIGIGLLIAHGMQKSEDFDHMMEARDAAPDKEEFDRNFKAMAEWLETYKREHPGATDADANRAFDEAWKG